MDQRQEFVRLAQAEGANLSQLARDFGISRTCAYKWIGRQRQAPHEQWALDRSRRPHSSPTRTPEPMEQAIVEVRHRHPAWGPRKIRVVLERQERWSQTKLPSPSTIAAILLRHELVSPQESDKRRAFMRFEHASPNDLWQMDFKGHFATRGGRCHALTVVDDHSRYALGVDALPNEKDLTTRGALVEIFRRYGLPDCLILDNGSCWGRSRDGIYSAFGVWLMRLGVRLSYSRPYHPQSRGKNERFNRTLKREAIAQHEFESLQECQAAFDHFRQVYNHERPHEALGMGVPASRYRPSCFVWREEPLPPVHYQQPLGQQQRVVAVGHGGQLQLGKQCLWLGHALAGEWVAVRPGQVEGVEEIFYCRQRIGVVDHRDHTVRLG